MSDTPNRLPEFDHLVYGLLSCVESIEDRGMLSASAGDRDGTWIVIVGAGKERCAALASAIATASGGDAVRESLIAENARLLGRIKVLEQALAADAAGQDVARA